MSKIPFARIVKGRIAEGEHRLKGPHMSWEHVKIEARCKACGHAGFRVDSSDDWGRSETSWEGFQAAPASDYEVARMRVGANDFPLCKCGSRDIEVGKASV